MSHRNRLAVLAWCPHTHKPDNVKLAGCNKGKFLIWNSTEGYRVIVFDAEFLQPDPGIDFVNKRKHWILILYVWARVCT